MKNILKAIALILALVTSVACLAACNSGDTQGDANDGDKENSDVEVGNKIGNLATSYSLDPVKGNEKVNIKDYRGKVVVLNFWGTWCTPCKNELPAFDEVAAVNDDVVIIAVHSVDGKEDAEGYIDANFPDSKIIFAYDLPRPGKTDLYYDLLGGEGFYPYTVIIDPEGVITYKYSGAMSHAQLLDAINSAKN